MNLITKQNLYRFSFDCITLTIIDLIVIYVIMIRFNQCRFSEKSNCIILKVLCSLSIVYCIVIFTKHFIKPIDLEYIYR